MRGLAALAALLIVIGLCLVIYVAFLAVLDRGERNGEHIPGPSPDPPEAPNLSARNRQWERYYRDLEEHARRVGDHGSADTYGSLARTYQALADQESR